MIKMLEIHTAAEHSIATGPTDRGPAAPRLERLPRPSFDLDMSQAAWSFKQSQWEAYISQSSVSEKMKVQQLKAACEERLLCRVYDAGDFATLDTEPLLLAQIKKIAVRKKLEAKCHLLFKECSKEPFMSFT